MDSGGLSTYGLNGREWEMSIPPMPQLGHGFLYPWFLRSGEVREFKSTMVQKLTKMQKKNRTIARTLHTAVQNFFCSLRSQIIYTFTFSFVLPPLFD